MDCVCDAFSQEKNLPVQGNFEALWSQVPSQQIRFFLGPPAYLTIYPYQEAHYDRVCDPVGMGVGYFGSG